MHWQSLDFLAKNEMGRPEMYQAYQLIGYMLIDFLHNISHTIFNKTLAVCNLKCQNCQFWQWIKVKLPYISASGLLYIVKATCDFRKLGRIELFKNVTPFNGYICNNIKVIYIILSEIWEKSIHSKVKYSWVHVYCRKLLPLSVIHFQIVTS